MRLGNRSKPKRNHSDKYFKLVVIFIEYFLFSSLSSRNSPFSYIFLFFFPLFRPKSGLNLPNIVERWLSLGCIVEGYNNKNEKNVKLL